MKALYGLLAAVALSTASGCVGARTTVVAPDAHYPVSLSRGVRDRDGSLVPGERRQVVGTFQEARTAWGMFYSLARLTPKTDISEAIDRQVRAAGGDAIVNARVGTLHCGANFVLFLPALPFWPGCVNVYVHGDIVKVLPAPANVAPSARAARSATPAPANAPPAPSPAGPARAASPPAAPARAASPPAAPARAASPPAVRPAASTSNGKPSVSTSDRWL